MRCNLKIEAVLTCNQRKYIKMRSFFFHLQNDSLSSYNKTCSSERAPVQYKQAPLEWGPDWMDRNRLQELACASRPALGDKQSKSFKPNSCPRI